MTAVRSVYVQNWPTTKPDERYKLTLTRGGKSVPGVVPARICRIEEEVMYWRKANHIHAWFVDNVQRGLDNCARYYVPMKQLKELLDLCERVLAASELVDGTINGGKYYDNEHPTGIAKRLPGKVIKDSTVARKLLPTREGFFFGSTEYDQAYLTDVIATASWARCMLRDHANGLPGDIFYSSSW